MPFSFTHFFIAANAYPSGSAPKYEKQATFIGSSFFSTLMSGYFSKSALSCNSNKVSIMFILGNEANDSPFPCLDLNSDGVTPHAAVNAREQPSVLVHPYFTAMSMMRSVFCCSSRKADAAQESRRSRMYSFTV